MSTSLGAEQRPSLLIPPSLSQPSHVVGTLLPTLTLHLPGSRGLCACCPHPHTPPGTFSRAWAPNTAGKASSPFHLGHTHTHAPHARTLHAHPYRKVVINPGAQASFLSSDHISKVREAGEQEMLRGRFLAGGGAGKKKSVAKDKKKIR